MEVVAKISNGRFLCEVNDTELEQFFDTYYGKGTKMEIGQKVDLGAGYDFASKAVDAMNKTEKFIQSNKEVIESIVQGIHIVGGER